MPELSPPKANAREFRDRSTADVVGVGFGPSNLAIAIALRGNGKSPAGPSLTAKFHEAQPEFGWHRGMLLDGASMQVSFLKDLVTMRDPTSDYSFLAYLHENRRLDAFVNQQSFFPSRIDFHRYLEWASARFADMVSYGSVVEGIEPVECGGEIAEFDILYRGPGSDRLCRTRAKNVVLAGGLEPVLPGAVEESRRIWHSSKLLFRVGNLSREARYRFAVVGAGQSAAEAAEYLHRTFPKAIVSIIHSRYGYSAADDTPFVNEIFDPGAVSTFFNASTEARQHILRQHGNANYAAVDTSLLRELYRRSYDEQVVGTPRLRILNLSRVVGGTETSSGHVELNLHNLVDSTSSTVKFDYAIMATGYKPRDPRRMLEPLLDHIKLEANGSPCVGRDYRVITAPHVSGGLYLQGSTEELHGISTTLLSNIAVRAGEIVESIYSRATTAAN
ncbi:lysine N(6)-hydroxylase/L-ornithine N(5)-oxygenase family protein [Nocardia abscessus]|uniref:lysine N(6)-hydroxylase/L-ornithine N(5)-oxygenase family protein n=1 Tax=Nocardia abscessus TaxID=120957 RepID=UPI00245843AB|nr:SidA/IucD/PvdA family monooxygenase [Nocardia abscessus]